MQRHKREALSLMAVLFLIFLVLKLIGFITWSWWLVTLPLWGPVALKVLVVVLLLVLAFT